MIRSLISRFTYWVFLIGLALWPHESVAQYVWNTAHTDFEGNRFYCFSAITSYGNSCIAGGSIIDTTEHSTERAIFRSEDAGRSWVVFHPESPIKNNIYWTGDSSYYRLIAQIDSLRIVAVGSIGDGSPIRSSDAGQTWHPILSGYNGFVISM